MTKDPEKIGKYRILERVGHGGMGVLYRGIDPVLDREVAIKLMLADFSADDAEQLRPRFYCEARSAAKLQHRNIVTVFEFDEENGAPYIVMELLRGTSLAARMTSNPALTLDDKLDVVAQLSAGLDYAHEQGVVHRDVKPANIFLLTDGSVKLLDFGIAKVVTSTLTRFGDVIGTASYMSPEQVTGSDQIDGRADIFSTGIVLYELLAGRKPFEANAAATVMMQILQADPPPLDRVAPGLPEELVAVVNRALAKDPANRFSRAGQLERELQQIRKAPRLAATVIIAGRGSDNEITRTPVPAPVATAQLSASTAATTTPPGRKWFVPTGLAGVVLVGAIIAVLTVGRSAAPPAAQQPEARVDSRATASAPVPPIASNAASPARAAAATSSPDGVPTATSRASLQIESDPPGATIMIDGRDTHQATPAAVTISGASPHRLRLSKKGFQPHEVRLVDGDLRSGPVSYRLIALDPPAAPPQVAPKVAAAPEVASVGVSLNGPYKFEVFEGPQMISGPSDSHELNISTGKTLRLVAPEFSLNQTVRIEGARDSHMTVSAPGLGKLTVRSTFETCVVTVGGRELGYPPVNAVPIASGSYQIDLVCPNGQNQRGFATIAPGQSIVAKVP